MSETDAAVAGAGASRQGAAQEDAPPTPEQIQELIASSARAVRVLLKSGDVLDRGKVWPFFSGKGDPPIAIHEICPKYNDDGSIAAVVVYGKVDDAPDARLPKVTIAGSVVQMILSALPVAAAREEVEAFFLDGVDLDDDDPDFDYVHETATQLMVSKNIGEKEAAIRARRLLSALRNEEG